MMIIGITGGIGSGKSTVSKYISEFGFTVVDLDQIARLVLDDNNLIAELTKAFGEDILSAGVLNRSKLAELAFENAEQKSKLDSIMLKPILNNTKTLIKKYNESGIEAIFLDAPLLFEAGLNALCDETWLIHTHEDIRINRVILRENTTAENVKKRISLQMPECKKAELADIVFDNNRDENFLKIQIETRLKEMDLL